eukprot:2286211-Rhodomonas_salina.4
MATIVSTSTTQLILTGIEYEIAKLKFPIGSTTQRSDPTNMSFVLVLKLAAKLASNLEFLLR